MTNHGITAKVIEDSINALGARLTTFQLRYPRFVHAEFMTHRMFSRNASSSRAIPVAKMIEQVRNEPAMPVHWGKNQPGMQAREEMTGADLMMVKAEWLDAAKSAANHAEVMMERGTHKQIANRILEPFQFISVVLTATEFDNWFELRDHEDADPTIAVLARVMREAMDTSSPAIRFRPDEFTPDTANDWHLPYITEDERFRFFRDPVTLAMISTARCARVSYLTHDGLMPDVDKDLALYERLVGSKPLHASPTEHPCRVAFGSAQEWMFKNLRGWMQHRIQVESALEYATEQAAS